jgi:hypothetical protein
MPNILTITVDNAAELLNTGAYGAGALIRIQTSATQAGTYADLTGTGSTPTLGLVSGTRLYTGYDPAGVSSSWYRTRYEDAGGTRLSDWTVAFQAGADDGLICSLDDVTERLFGSATVSNADQETLLDIIREVGSSLEHATGRWLRPRPASGTTTYRFHTHYGLVLRVPVGIRSITSLGVASTSQPDTGGTYTTLSSSAYYLDPPEIERDVDWPATSIRMVPTTGSYFWTATFGAEVTGSFGFAAVPADIRGVAIEAATRRYIGKETAAPAIAVGPAGGVRLLASLSPDARAIVESYRVRPV